MGKYVVRAAEEYYDMDSGRCDARGYPIKEIRYTGEEHEMSSEPEVGDTWTYQEYGRWYRKTIKSVHFRGMVYEDVEGYDVEYYTEELKDYCPPGSNRVGNFLFDSESDNTVITGYMLGDQKEKFDLVIPDTVKKIADEAFKENIYIKSLTVPGSVKVIGDHAFEDCYELTRLDLGHGVHAIGRSAFKGCSKLETVELPDSVIYLGGYTFEGCYGLKTVHLPKSITELFGTFKDCLQLTAVDIPYGVTDLIVTFEDCGRLEHVELPNTVVNLDKAFRGCGALKSITIPSGQKVLHEYEFLHCKSLTSIVIPDSVEKIEDMAFCGCSSLKSIEIPASVKHVGSSAFRGCSSLKSIEIPASVKHVGSSAFEGCKCLEQVCFLGYVEYLGEDAFKDCPAKIEIPKMESKKFDNLPEKLIKHFINNPAITTIELPHTVREIGFGAFYNCQNLVSVKIPDSVTIIDERAFERCEKLRDIVIPDSVTKIGRYAFKNCKSLSLIIIPQSVKEIGPCAFEGSGITHVEVPETLEKYDCAFSNCGELTSVVIPSTDYHRAFSKCPKLKTVSFSKPLTKIGTDAFKDFGDFKDLKSYTIPDTVTEICGEAFCGTSISSLVIPESVVKIASDAFRKSSIVEVKWPATLNTITGFFGNYELKEIAIPNTVTTIGEAAFFQCLKLVSVKIPDSVTSIEADAFNLCKSLAELELPESVKVIGERAFWYCENLSRINIPKGVDDIPDFLGCDNLKTVLISREKLEKFKPCFSRDTEFLFYEDMEFHEKTDAADSSPKKEKEKDSKNMETGKTLELLGIQAKMIGFKAVIRTGLFSGNEELRLKRDGITLDVSIDSNGEATIKPVIPVWFQIVCVFVAMIILSIVMSLMADQTVLVKGGWIVVLAGILLASPIYKSIKRKALDAAIESVSHLL